MQAIKTKDNTDIYFKDWGIGQPLDFSHGCHDQIVPIGAAAMLSFKIVKGAILKVYPGAPHGMCSTLKDKVAMVEAVIRPRAASNAAA